MANVKITELTAATALASTDVLAIVDVGADATKKVSVSDLLRNLPDGSAASPSLAFADDQNTGVLSPNANELAFATSGTQRLVINSNGQIGIGTASPSDLLQITPTSTREGLTIKTTGTTFGGINIDTNRTGAGHTLGDIRFMWNGTGVAGITGHTGSDTTNKDDGRLIFNTASAGSATERMRIDSSGKVGIGVSSPSAPLDVESASDQTVLRLRNNGGNNTRLLFSNKAAGLGEIFYQGDFRFVDDENSDAERLRIDSSGNVGIGTTSPSQKLHIYEATDGDVGIRIQNNDGFAELEVDADELNYNADTHVFNNQADSTELMRINNSGNVGIGTTSPSTALHVKSTSSSQLTLQRDGSGDQIAGIIFNDGGGDQNRISSGGNSLRFARGTGNTESMRIDTSGRLLIGSSSARSVRNVAAALQVEGTSANASSLSLIRNSDGNTNPYLLFAKTRGTSVGSNTIVQENDSLGVIEFAGADNTDTNSRAAFITCEVDGTPGSNDMPGRLVFSTSADGANVPTERLRIDSKGNLGVGVTPDDWGGSRKAIQFDSAGAAYLCNDSSMGVVSNMYFNGSNDKYINAGSASAVYVQNDNVVFNFAGAGSADANASFVTRVRVDNDGLKFGSDTASTNALEDYEEGTFTPTLAQGVTNPGYTNVGGNYTKIGNCVTFTIRMRVTSGTDNSAQVLIGGLPFPSSSSLREGGAFFNYRHDLNSSSAGPFMHIAQNSSQITFYNNIGGAWIGTNGSGLINRTLHIQGQYFV